MNRATVFFFGGCSRCGLAPGGLEPGVAGDGVFCASQMQFFSVPYRAVQSPRGSDSIIPGKQL